METDKLPAGTNANGETTNNKPTVGNKERTAYFGDALREDYATGTDRITDLVKKLNKSYFIDNSFTSKKENIKAVAYMLDTKAWSSFKDTIGNASYAVGGSTIEMLFKSYNEKYPDKNYEAQASNETGYQIRINGGEWKNNMDSGIECLDISDSLYTIGESTNANATWLASPSFAYSNYIMYVDCNGGIAYHNYGDTSVGFRPLICLNSNVELQEAENGFLIK